MQLEEEVICHIRCERGASELLTFDACVNVHYRCASYESACVQTLACICTAHVNICFVRGFCYQQHTLELSLQWSSAVDNEQRDRERGKSRY